MLNLLSHILSWPKRKKVEMLHFEPKELTVPEIHRLLLGGVAPRPIALVSTLSADGILNLSPFSFFNAFGANPPIIAFSPARRGRDGSFKDTYNNLKAIGQCVVQAVPFNMVEQINLASAEFPPEVNEFEKCGLTPIKSDLVKPMRVKESPFQMECILKDLLSYGNAGASANIAICEVVKFHVDENIFSNGIIHPNKVELVARMGGDFYIKAYGGSVFELQKPRHNDCIGFDNLPDFIKNLSDFNSNELAKLASATDIPSKETVENFVNESKIFDFSSRLLEEFYSQKNHRKMFQTILALSESKTIEVKDQLKLCAKISLENNDIESAWKILIYYSLL